MRERLSCVVELRRFGVWRAAVVAVAAAAIATMAAWGGLALVRQVDGSTLIAAVAAALAGASLLVARSLLRVEPGTLAASADGTWTFAIDRPGRRSGDVEGEVGEIAVALDLGSFLLLSLVVPGESPRRPRRRWLPVQRRGLESSWHALRCAVYARPPAAAGRAAASGALPE